MANWTPKTTAPTQGQAPYDWSSSFIWECTWYAYYRVIEGSGLNEPPCWQTGSGSTGSGLWNNAKTWQEHYRHPWEVKGLDYIPVAGDIIVFDGTYGHVVVVELVNSDGTLVVSDCNLINGDHTYGVKYDYEYGQRIYGLVYNTGNCLGALHNPNVSPTPVVKPLILPIKKRRRNKIYLRRL